MAQEPLRIVGEEVGIIIQRRVSNMKITKMTANPRRRVQERKSHLLILISQEIAAVQEYTLFVE